MALSLDVTLSIQKAGQDRPTFFGEGAFVFCTIQNLETSTLSGSEWKESKRSTLKRDRLHQIHRWLVYAFGRKSRLRVERLPKDSSGCLGYVEIGSGIPLIRVSKYLSKSESIVVLLHEYSHVLSHYTHGPHWERNNEGHDKKFYSILCEVENKYFYEGGNADSADF